MKRGNLSLATVLICLIVIVVSATLAIVGTVAYRAYSAQEWDKFHRTVDLEADRLVIALAPAIWNLEFAQIQKLMESVMQEPRYLGISVDTGSQRLSLGRDQWDATVSGAPPPPVAEAMQRRRPVIHAGEPVGELTLYATAAHLETAQRQAASFFIAFALLLDLMLSVALYLAMQHLILRPLRQVERYASEVAVGNTSQTADGRPALFGELNRLSLAIDDLLGQLGQRNQALLKSSEQFKTVIRLMPIPVVLYDGNGNFLHVNERFEATYGYTLQETPDTDSWFRNAYPDPSLRAEVMATWVQEITAARNEHRPIRALPYCVRCRDGSTKYAEIGGIVSDDINIATLIDITDRTLAEEELRRHREHLEELVDTRTGELIAANRRLEETQFAMDHAGIGIAWIDQIQGRFLYVNDQACTLFGRTRNTLLQANASDICDALPAGLARAHDAPRDPLRIETTVRQADGWHLPIEISLYLPPSATNADDTRYCVFITDISQRKAAEALLIEAKHAAELSARTRSEFLANMSHEIRTPMNAIIGMSELALNAPLDAKPRNFIQKVNQSAKSLLGILNDILDFSKVEAGRLDIEQLAFDPDTVFDDLSNIAMHQAGNKGLAFLFDLPPDLPRRLIGDPGRLNQILINLVGNAIKFTESGTVTVACRMHPGDTMRQIQLDIAVQDTGIGLSTSQCNALFSPFQQGDNSISRRYGGTGLGLAISRNLARLMGGDIRVSSRIGEGSTFVLSLPFSLPDDRLPPLGLPAAYRNQAAVVVHPHGPTRTLLRGLLEQLGMRARAFESAGELMTALSSQPPIHLLLCGATLPDSAGVALIRTLKESRIIAMPKCIMLTSPADQETLDETMTGDLPVTVMAAPLRPGRLLAILNGQSDPPRPVSPVPAARLDGMHILLVEDNELNQELALEILEARGARVAVASNGEIALEHLAARQFDCVLMDVHMPVMDGLTATCRIRADGRWPGLPVIAMTAAAMPDEREQTLLAGMDAHIAKPIETEALIATILHLTTPGSTPPPVEVTRPPLPPASPQAELQILDTEFGLRVVNGRAASYHRILEILLAQTGEKLERLQQACAASRHDEAARLAHDIKGSSATVGAMQLTESMRRIEAICKGAPDSGDLSTQCEAARTAWAMTEKACRHYLGKAGAPSVGTAALDGSMEILGQLRRQLVASEANAVGSANRLLALAPPEIDRSQLSALVAKVKAFQFDDALMDLDRLKETLTGKHHREEQ